MVEDETLSETDREIVERGPGTLTESQRQYLIGSSNIEAGSQRERTIRSRIRERTINGISDTVLALYYLDDRDIAQLEKYFGRDDGRDMLYSAIVRLMALTRPEDISPTRGITKDEHDFDSKPDVVMDVVPNKLSEDLREAYWHRYQQMEEQSWIPVDAKLTGQVAFDRADSESIPDDIEKSAEFRDLLIEYEQGELSKEELIEKFPFETDE